MENVSSSLDHEFMVGPVLVYIKEISMEGVHVDIVLLLDCVTALSFCCYCLTVVSLAVTHSPLTRDETSFRIQLSRFGPFRRAQPLPSRLAVT